MSQRAVTVRDLARAIPGAALIGDAATVVQGVTYDSRLVNRGDLFAALRGADFDGHAFVSDAETRGAAALLVESSADSLLTQIKVTNTRAALAALSAAFFDHPSRHLGVIGVTGTDGKTTTAHLIDHVLRATGHKTGMVGTVVVRIGDQSEMHATRQTTPESSEIQSYLRQMVDDSVDWAILEATSHGLAMHRLDHVDFRIGAVTNITHEHLDYHGHVENYRRAKAILLERVAAHGGVAVINADDPGARAVLPFARGARVVRYSMVGGAADVRAVDIQYGTTETRFRLETGSGDGEPIALPYIGEFNVANAICAASVALAAGLELPTIASALGTAPAVPGRMAVVKAGQPFGVVVDYAHTPDSLRKVLVLLRGLHPAGRLIAVFGSAGERDVEKRPLQGQVSAQLADISVITSEDPRFEDPDGIIAQIATGARVAGAKDEVTLFCRTDRREAIQLAFELAGPGDCVLLAGKGHEASIIWGRDKRPWDEAGVARELLLEAGYGELRG
jgi:UDP-N-acetylmuramoyl-L-alanyl-D-glutamate--2,6-diaminopimelate ligase